ncbi:MAG: helix-turn-helix transcriptional regulator [Cyanobacteria bacterium P01_G01_bin.38]
MKVRRTHEWSVPNLPAELKSAAERSDKSISQICREADISTAFWYQLVKGNKESVTYQTLSAICQALEITTQDVGVSDPEDEFQSI